MLQAVEAAERVRGRTAPNPWVGAVLVAPGDSHTPTTWFVGATAPPGGPHAEVTALTAAGDRARGATLYVTLEPCAHHGRTPPCTEAVLGAGVARVVVGMVDPDPLVDGRGVEVLRSAGMDVEVGVAADVVGEQLAAYVAHRRTGRPWVVLKLAATLDGRIAAPDGSSRWITGEAARRDVHRLRAVSDAVIVGAGTVRADDPSLTVRLPPTTRCSAGRTISRCGSCSDVPPPRPPCGPRSSWVATRSGCSSSSAAGDWSRSSSKAEPPWPTNSTPEAWSTGTCCTSPRPSSAATTHDRCSPARVRPPSGACGVGRFAR